MRLNDYSSMSNICYACKRELSELFNFCPHCGVALKNNGNLTITSQVGIYLLSFFLPPLGVYPAIKLLRRANPKAKRTAVIALVLTFTAIAITVWSVVEFINYYNSILLRMN